MAHAGLPDEFFARVLMLLGDHNVLGHAKALQERLRIPRRAQRCRHVVAAHRLRVPTDIQRECAFSTVYNLVRSGRAGPELVLGPHVAIEEHSVVHVDVLVDRPHAGVVIPLVPLLCEREGPLYLVDQVPQTRPDDVADGSWAPVRLLGCRGAYHSFHGETSYTLGSDELEGRHPGALLRSTVVDHCQRRRQLISSVLMVLDDRPQLPHDGPVVPFHLDVRRRVVRRGVSVGDVEERTKPLEERGAELGTIVE